MKNSLLLLLFPLSVIAQNEGNNWVFGQQYGEEIILIKTNHLGTLTSTTNLPINLSKGKLLKITDLLGRETKQTNQPLFYIYDDGTVEKKIIIE